MVIAVGTFGGGRKAVAVGGASAYAVLAFLVNGFAPLVDALSWLKYLSFLLLLRRNDPISNGVDLAVLAGRRAS